MNYHLKVLMTNHKPETIKWALAQCLRRPKEAELVVAAIEKNERMRPTILDGLRELARIKPHIRPKELQ